MKESLRNLVRRRARHRCEYCGLLESLALVVPLHADHIIARKHGGRSNLPNLAAACHHCNFHKQTDLVGFDPLTSRRTALFNPRRHKWRAHFRWDGVYLFGKSAIGRTTVELLSMNADPMIELRSTLREEGRFPW